MEPDAVHRLLAEDQVVWRNSAPGWPVSNFAFYFALACGGFAILLAMGFAAVHRGDKQGWIAIAAAIIGGLILLLVAVLNWPDARQQITINFDARTVTFENFRSYRRFWMRPRVALVTYRFEDIVAVERGRNHEAAEGTGQLIVHTDTDRFVIFGFTEEFHDMAMAMERIRTPYALPFYRTCWWPPLVGMVIVVAAIVGMLVTGLLP